MAGSLPLLDGYSIVEWPDLSCDRTPSSVIHTAGEQFRDFNIHTHGSLLLAAISRMFGAYCATSDVLLAVRPPSNVDYVLVRVSWTEQDSWEDVAARIGAQPRHFPKRKISLEDIRRAFELPDKSRPCPMLVQFTRSEGDILTDFPAIFAFDSTKSSLSLSASKTLLHPSVNQQILAQVISLFRYAGSHPKSPIASNPSFPPNLMSIFTRLPAEEISRVYPHIPLVSFATEYLERRAKSNPNSIAVQWFPELTMDDPNLPFEAITYAELNHKASQLARWLVKQGLHEEDRVAICLSRDLRFHAAFIGIMRAGGCYVPIDPELPVERKAYIARDSGAKFVLTSSDLSTPELFGSSAVYVDAPEVIQSIEAESGDEFNIAKPEGLAYMLYTSGTTGNPKGCLLTNHGLAQAILALSSTAADVRMEDLTQGRYLAVASIAFDVHLAETLVPMALGMPLLSATRSQLLENLPLYTKLLGITHLGIVPSLIEATLNATKDDEGGLSLRYIASGGEKMSDSILDKWANHHQVRLANFYGPSEVTIGCCARYMSSSTPRANIGKPLANVSGYVVDADLNIVPRGAIGELVVEGPLVGRGYHGRPDLTEKVFVEWPVKGCWAYRTGDLVRMMPDSTIEILGRIDTQIKLRGVRIESEGISAIVRKAETPLPGMVLDATTVLAKHPALGSDQLVSFVTWDPSVPVSTRKSLRPTLCPAPQGLLKSIRSICQAELASYMRPSHIIPLNWLPLSSNGKTDAKILVDIFKNLEMIVLASLISGDDGAPSRHCTQKEQEVFEVLKQHTPSYPQQPYPELNIFECGLDSMGIIRFTSDLKSTFGKSISATDIMKKPSLKDISELLDATIAKEGLIECPVDFIDPHSRDYIYSLYPESIIEDILPPFPVQEGVLARSVEDTTLYVQHVLLKLQGDTELGRLRVSWEAAVLAHPIFRTVFHIDKSAWQVVLESCDLSNVWSEQTLNARTPDEFQEQFYGSLANEITKDINQNISLHPPFRLTSFTCIDMKILVLSIHHALYDGTALPVLLKDVELKYLGLDPIPTVSLRAIVAEISKLDYNSAQQFWADAFRGFSWPQPAFGSSTNISSSAKYLSIQFDRRLSVVKEIANRKQVTLQAFLSFIFAYLIGSRIYHSNDVSFGVIRSGRMLPVQNIDVAVCPTITVVPMRVRLQDSDETLRAIQRGISDMTEHEHVPLGKVQSWLRPGQPLFEVLFSVSVQQHEASKIWEPCNYEPPAADYPLSVEAVVNGQDDSLSIRAAWLDGHISEEQVAGLLKQFESIALSLNQREQLALPNSHELPNPSVISKSHEKEEASPLVVDPVVITDLQHAISEFLEVPPTLLTNRVSFISLGLDSIKAVGLAKRIRKLGYDVTSSEILKASTLKRLAGVIRHNKQKKLEPLEKYTQLLQKVEGCVPKSEVLLSAEDVVRIFPATALQSGMLSETIGSDGRLYIHAFPLILSADIDPDRLKSSWESASKIVDILRTSFYFISDNGQWAQVVHSSCPLKWSSEHLEDDVDPVVAVQSFVSNIECADEFSFSTPPIWLRLFTPRSGKPPILALVMHHALYDGISVARLLDIVQSTYHLRPVSYALQFTDLLPDFFRQEIEGTPFWVKHLGGLQRFLLPSSSKPSTSIQTVIRAVTVDTIRLSDLLKASEATLQCLLQGALAKVLGDLTNANDVVFGHVVSGRGSQGTEDVIGPILNTVPCRVILGDGMSAVELLRSIHHSNMETVSWQQASLRAIQKALEVDRIWDCLFTFQPLAVQTTDAGAIWTLHGEGDHNIQIQYPLHVEVEQTDAGFLLRCASRSSILDQEALTKFVDAFAKAIQHFVATPTQPISKNVTIPSLTGASNAASISATVPTNDADGSIATIQPALLSAIRCFAPDVKISLETPLPALGVDSITAIQISGKCRRAGLRLSATQILSSQTVKDLVQQVETSGSQAKSEPKQPEGVFQQISDQEKESIARRFGGDAKYIENISVTTAGMKWHIGGWQRRNGSLFQFVFTFKLSDDVDLVRFKSAWDMFIRRHEILRSTFATAPGGIEPRLVTFSNDFQFDHWNEEVVSNETFYRNLLDKMKDIASNPLPISRPPIRATLFRSSEQAFLILHIHHFQYDAWSMQILLNDLSSVYYYQEPWATNDFRSFVSLFNPNEARLNAQRSYWQNALSTSFKPAIMPSLLKDIQSRLPAPSGQQNLVTVPSALTDVSRYELRARGLGVTLQTVLLAAWAQVQANRSSTSESTFGVWQVSRSGHIEGIERLAVPCVNVLPIHVKLGGSLVDVANQIQKELSTRSSQPVIEHSDLVNIAKWVGMPGETPIFNANVNVVKVPVMLKRDGLLEPVKIPHYIPRIAVPTVTSTLDKLAVSALAQNDVVVDIVLFEETDSILMSIEAVDNIMTEEQARDIIREWASIVSDTLVPIQ